MRKIFLSFVFIFTLLTSFILFSNFNQVKADCNVIGHFPDPSCGTTVQCQNSSNGYTQIACGNCSCTLFSCSGSCAGGFGNCGNAKAPGCNGTCGGGTLCAPTVNGQSCTCKPALDCNGTWTTQCKKTGCSGKNWVGDCYRNGKPARECRVLSCGSSNPVGATPLSPGNGTTIPGQVVRLTWNPSPDFGSNCPSNINQYFVQMGATPDFLIQVATVNAPTSYFDLDVSSFSPGTKIYWQVKTSNGCDTRVQSSAVWYFVTQGGITGNVYNDITNTCSTTQLWNIGALSVSTNTGINTTVVGGKYSLSTSPGTYDITLNNIPLGYVCSTSCPQSCPTASGITSPSTANFFLTYKPPAWWQVKDSDLTSLGDLGAKPPSANLFDLEGGGGYPGVPSYSGSTTLTNATVSTPGWISQDTPTGAKTFNYQYFANQIPSDITSATTNLPVDQPLNQAAIDANSNPVDGYYWYKFDGSSGSDLSTSGNINIGTKRVVLLVNSANFYIKGNIILTKGQGFFMVVVGQTADGSKGNLVIDPGVGGGASPNLEGIYVADSEIDTGTGGTSTDTKLYVRGTMVGYGGVKLQRDLGDAENAITPGEFFEYAPDQIMLFPTKLGFRKINWKEVAP